MTKTSKASKITAIVLSLVMLLGAFAIAGTATASAATDRVSLYSSSVSFSKYGGATYEVYVKTNDNANNQTVTIHYNYLDTMGWQDTTAAYVTSLNDGSKIWKASFSSFNCKYAIKYEADGQIIWDNNNGKDYTGSDVVGTAPVAVERLGYQYNTENYQINAVLQNYAYHKNVFVRYTTDGWKSYQDKALNYVQTNANGSETWSTKVNANGSDFQYAICYQVNGTEYWANNFGANYDGTYYIHR